VIAPKLGFPSKQRLHQAALTHRLVHDSHYLKVSKLLKIIVVRVSGEEKKLRGLHDVSLFLCKSEAEY